MDKVRKIISHPEYDTLEAKVFQCFKHADLEEGLIFPGSIQSFLLFDYQYITEPSRFLSFVQNEGTGVYIGHLSLSYPNGAIDGAIFAPKSVTEADISAAFNENISPSDGPIQVFVKRGFVIPADGEWAIWFSTYWEIAVAGFLLPKAASDFAERHPQIMFQTNEMVISHYALNPASAAPLIFEYYLEHNKIELD